MNGTSLRMVFKSVVLPDFFIKNKFIIKFSFFKKLNLIKKTNYQNRWDL